MSRYLNIGNNAFKLPPKEATDPFYIILSGHIGNGKSVYIYELSQKMESYYNHCSATDVFRLPCNEHFPEIDI